MTQILSKTYSTVFKSCIIMKSIYFLFISLAVTSAFVVQPQVKKYGSSISMVMPDTPAVSVDMEQASSVVASKGFEASNYLGQQKLASVNNFLKPSTSLESSSNVVSLKERPPPPTAEEIEAKKRNFNLWFWGGGFVAPFLATFYYFGLKFWER
jgi:hypothetical protein